MGVSLPQLAVRGTVARTECAPNVFDGAAGLKDIFVRRRADGGYTVASAITEHFIGGNSFRYFFNFLPSMKSAGEVRLALGADVTQPLFAAKRWNAGAPSPFENTRVLNPAPSNAVLNTMRVNLDKRLPALRDAKFVEAWAGMIDAMPDVVPVMDSVASCPGLFIATGFSAHGFGIGPGAGKVIADLVEGRTSPHDLSRFRLSRFSDGSKLVPGPGL
jgi:glycine/D-amino acid oxidase-like deaminating enzyme